MLTDAHIDLRSKFSAIHREYSPNPRKFYAFCTSVTDTATTAGIIASGACPCFLFLPSPFPGTAVIYGASILPSSDSTSLHSTPLQFL
jgi:hypothetical protein